MKEQEPDFIRLEVRIGRDFWRTHKALQRQVAARNDHAESAMPDLTIRNRGRSLQGIAIDHCVDHQFVGGLRRKNVMVNLRSHL
jgi:hypothetical protein